MHKSLVLALFLGAVKPDQVFQDSLDNEVTEAEAFTVGFHEAIKKFGLTDVGVKPYAEQGHIFKYDQDLVDLPEETTDLYEDQTCDSGIARWNLSENSFEHYKLIVNKGLWNDPLFGADQSSLLWDGKGIAAGTGEIFSKVAGWKRPRELYPDLGETLFGSIGQPAPTGIKQGYVGDCWFLASLAAMGEEPHRITDLMENPTSYPDSGAFRFKFWSMNKWVGINIDDRLPVISWGDGFHTWATSKSTNGAWWTPLMEKAYAKFNQNYDRIQAGSGFEGLKTLSGMPVQMYQFGKIDADYAWERFHTYSGRNFPMTTSCCRESNPDGLIHDHAYTFLGTVQLSNGVKLAQIRNPWGKEEYTGPWSDKDSKWTPEFLKEAGHTHGDDGSFFMPMDYWHRYFDQLNVAYVEDYEQISRSDHHMAQKVFQWSIENPEDQEFYITVEVMSSRNYPRTCEAKVNNMFLNTYMLKDGEYIGGIGFVGNGLNHVTVGTHGQPYSAGAYTFQIVNWNWESKKQEVDFTVSLFAKKKEISFNKL